MDYTVNNLGKDYYGVFTVGDDLVGTLDDAWATAQKGGSNVVKTTSNGNDAYIVNMNRKVGYEGGIQGSRDDLYKKIVVKEGTGDVITAFPVK